ncbi:MAG: oligopeptide:H+ symporter [Gemmatimonadota bacterium]
MNTNSSFDTAFFGHPRGLSVLFFTEFWERFSYYGMRALLILFMTAQLANGGLGFDTAKAGIIYGAYTSLVYLMSVPGGWLADHFFGQRRAALYGAVVIMFGHIALAIPTLTGFYVGLALVVLGTGLLKPNVSTMVGQLYRADDTRRDAGFSIYYMGINLGAFLSPFFTGWLGQSESFRGILTRMGLQPEHAWHWGFGLAAVGMFVGIIQYMMGWKYLGETGLEPVEITSAEARGSRNLQLGIGLAFTTATIGLLWVLNSTGRIVLTPVLVSKGFGVLLLAAVVFIFGRLLLDRSWTREERTRLVVVLILFLASCMFWALYEQAGSTLSLFAQRNTDSSLFGMAFPSSWFQSVPALFVITLAPVFGLLWLKLGPREPSTPTKFTIGLVLVAAGFAVLIIPAAAGGRASPLWLCLTFLLHVMGELCLSPVGLSATTRLAPARVGGMMMGVFLMSIAVGTYLGGQVASVYDKYSLATLFALVAAAALIAAVILAMFIKPIARMLAR